MLSHRDILTSLMTAAVPERSEEVGSLWERYHPDVVVVEDRSHVTLNATRERIEFDPKTMEIFWLIGFGGWKAIACYAPHVILSAASGKPLLELIRDDGELPEVERDYKERRASAQRLIESRDPAMAPWPPDLPRPTASRDSIDDPQFKVAFDLTCLAAAFAFFHEFRHVMLDCDQQRPKDLREEEIACDVWAREFMTAKLAAYAKTHGHDYQQVLEKRSMALALAALILHEITPVAEHGGNCQYFSVATRIEALTANTPLGDDSHFWVFIVSLLIGVLRQKNIPFDPPAMSVRKLSRYLIALL